MERRKNETIANLENHFYEGKDNKEIELLKEENQKFAEDLKELSNKNDHLSAQIEEKDQYIEKSEIISKFYEKLKIEIEEVKS